MQLLTRISPYEQVHFNILNGEYQAPAHTCMNIHPLLQYKVCFKYLHKGLTYCPDHPESALTIVLLLSLDIQVPLLRFLPTSFLNLHKRQN